MRVWKYLNISNHQIISDKLFELVTTSLYKNNDSKRSYLSFTPIADNFVKVDIKTFRDFWSFIDCESVLDAVPELDEELKTLDVTPLGMSLIVVRIGYGKLHSDISAWDIDHRINWPVANCETSQTRYFRLKENTQPIKVGTDEKYFFAYNPNDIEEELEPCVLSKPIVFNFKVPHSIRVNFGADVVPRIILAIDFKSNTLKL